MPSWTVPSDTHALADTGHTSDHNKMADDLTLVNSAAPVVSGGLTGATAATRYAGGTASGAPASGTFAAGDFVIDQTGKVWICNTAGTPGVWSPIGGRYTARLTSQQSTTSTSFVTVTGLSVASLPVGSYIFRAVIFCSNGTFPGVAQFSVSTPTTSALGFSGTNYSSSGVFTFTSAQTAAANLAGSNSNTTVYPVEIWGSMVTTGTGTFAVTFSTSNGSDTTFANTGSWLEIIAI